MKHLRGKKDTKNFSRAFVTHTHIGIDPVLRAFELSGPVESRIDERAATFRVIMKMDRTIVIRVS